MTGIAIFFLIFSIVLVWGGLVASALALRARPERASFPPGGFDDDGNGPQDPRDT